MPLFPLAGNGTAQRNKNARQHNASGRQRRNFGIVQALRRQRPVCQEHARRSKAIFWSKSESLSRNGFLTVKTAETKRVRGSWMRLKRSIPQCCTASFRLGSRLRFLTVRFGFLRLTLGGISDNGVSFVFSRTQVGVNLVDSVISGKFREPRRLFNPYRLADNSGGMFYRLLIGHNLNRGDDRTAGPTRDVVPRVWIPLILPWLVLDHRLKTAAIFAVAFLPGHGPILPCLRRSREK